MYVDFHLIWLRQKQRNNIKLCVRQVFILDDCDDLMPEWFNQDAKVVHLCVGFSMASRLSQ